MDYWDLVYRSYFRFIQNPNELYTRTEAIILEMNITPASLRLPGKTISSGNSDGPFSKVDQSTHPTITRITTTPTRRTLGCKVLFMAGMLILVPQIFDVYLGLRSQRQSVVHIFPELAVTWPQKIRGLCPVDSMLAGDKTHARQWNTLVKSQTVGKTPMFVGKISLLPLLFGGLNPSEKYESQLGWLFPIYGKMIKVPNHQPVFDV